ncbi:hypothetical protein BH20ACI4_BH20ACI4_22940 [soil metagenome]
MICQNTACGKQIDDDSTFCVICGTSQTARQPSVVEHIPMPNDGFMSSGGAVVTKTPTAAPQNTPAVNQSNPAQSQNYKFIEFRASENIWNFKEPEPFMQPEQRRPVLILDEQTILLSETHKHLSLDELLTRVQSIIKEKQVPVETFIAQSRWINDVYEVRPRIIAALKDHAYSGLKMILGLDYMGNWATLQFQIGMQPDPLPKPPPNVMSANQKPMLLIVGGIIAGFIGFMVTAAGANSYNGGSMVAFGILLLIAGIGGVVGGLNLLNKMNAEIDTQRIEREKYEREQYERALYKARMELFRTFKIDDAMLFHEAMNKIFMQVVDDVIEQGGGKIVKEIKGGENKLFDIQTNVPQNQPVQQPAQPIRTDAAKKGI